MNYNDVTFGLGERIVLDDAVFTGCTFSGATLVYSGTGTYSFNNCNIVDFTLDLTGPASRTIDLLRVFHGHDFPVIGRLFPRRPAAAAAG